MSNKSAIETLCSCIEQDALNLNWTQWPGLLYEALWNGHKLSVDRFCVAMLGGVRLPNGAVLRGMAEEAAAAAILRSLPDDVKQHPPKQKHVVTLRDDAAPWLRNMVELANGGANIVVNLDNDNQYAYDETGWSWDDADDDEAPPEFEGLRGISPHDMVVELFAALGIKAQSV